MRPRGCCWKRIWATICVSLLLPSPCGRGLGEVEDWLLFDAAVDVLVAMQRAPAPTGLPVWDAAMMADTALATLFDWWWPAMFRHAAPDAARRDFAAALETMLAPIAAGPTCFVHRDFFAGNLIWLPERDRHPSRRRA